MEVNDRPVSRHSFMEIPKEPAELRWTPAVQTKDVPVLVAQRNGPANDAVDPVATFIEAVRL